MKELKTIHSAMTRYLKSHIYIYIYQIAPSRYNLSPIIYQLPNNNSQSFTQTKIKPFHCTKFVITPVKGFCLVRDI